MDSSAGGIGIFGLIVLFWNFDGNDYDLYDKTIQFLSSGVS